MTIKKLSSTRQRQHKILYDSLNSSENKRKAAASEGQYQFYGGILAEMHEPGSLSSAGNGIMYNDTLIAFDRLPFYCSRDSNVSLCCFNHAIGLPEKDGEPKQLFDYEIDLLEKCKSNKYIAIRKATGLGITEFFLRWIAFNCLVNKDLANANVCIVTGPRIELAVTLVKRFKQLFEHLFSFDDKETVANLHSVHVEAFPSHHLDTMRGLTDVKIIFIDEAAFFPVNQQEQVRYISERYIAKSDPHIILVSTPNIPNDLIDQIWKEDESACIYKRIDLPYTVGLGKIYTELDIVRAKQSPTFEREYNLKHSYGVGNAFLEPQIEGMIVSQDFLDQISPQTIAASTISVGCDPGFGSSKFSYVVTGLIDGRIIVLDCQEYERADFNEMIEVMADVLMLKYPQAVCYVDAANPSFIRSLKIKMGGTEDSEYERVLERARHDKINPGYLMRVLPVNFRESGRSMMTLLQQMASGGVILISKRFDVLINQMRIARTKPDGNLDKDISSISSFDAFDALRLSCNNWHYTPVV